MKKGIIGIGLLLCIIYIIRPSDHAIINASPTGETIVCFGDSLSAGVGASDGMDYPSQLAKLIDEEIINKGISGDTTAKALARIDDIIALKPRIVLITIGGNDLKNGVQKDKAFVNLKIIVQRLQAQGALIILGGLNPPLLGRGYGQGYIDFAKANGVVLIPNVFKGILGKTNLMSDRIHPNNKGYAIMAQYFADAISPYL